jgi:hypothetical protein
MVHITCDVCGKKLRQGEEERYIVKIEAYAATDPNEITEADLDEDHMDAVGQMLRECEENEGNTELTEPYSSFRYDLCLDCHKKFVRDPLAKDKEQKFDFSKN